MAWGTILVIYDSMMNVRIWVIILKR